MIPPITIHAGPSFYGPREWEFDVTMEMGARRLTTREYIPLDILEPYFDTVWRDLGQKIKRGIEEHAEKSGGWVRVLEDLRAAPRTTTQQKIDNVIQDAETKGE